jgi:D-aminopeptidase
MRALSIVLPAMLMLGFAAAGPQDRPRLREFGLSTGTLPPGPLNAITDVAGVLVGQTTLIEGTSIRTGVTAVLPHGGNVFQDKVPAAISVANGFGKLAGSTQVEELGAIETPIVLTNTLAVPTAADAVIDYILGLPGNERVESVNPVVGETNDGVLNDIRGRAVKKDHVLAAIRTAKGGPAAADTALDPPSKGSCMIVVATDAPLDSRNLKRLAKRALLGIARTGGYFSNGSGDYAIAFSTAKDVRVPHQLASPTQTITVLRNEAVSPLFLAAAEAAEEAILNSLFKAHRVEGKNGHVAEALPLDKLRELLKK